MVRGDLTRYHQGLDFYDFPSIPFVCVLIRMGVIFLFAVLLAFYGMEGLL
jgi:hypothetical protein